MPLSEPLRVAARTQVDETESATVCAYGFYRAKDGGPFGSFSLRNFGEPGTHKGRVFSRFERVLGDYVVVGDVRNELKARGSPDIDMPILALEGEMPAGISGAPITERGSLNVIGVASGANAEPEGTSDTISWGVALYHIFDGKGELQGFADLNNLTAEQKAAWDRLKSRNPRTLRSGSAFRPGPGAAWSFLFPGLGQLADNRRQPGRGFLAAGAIAGLYAYDSYRQARADQDSFNATPFAAIQGTPVAAALNFYLYEQANAARETSRQRFDLAFFLYGFVYLSSLVDAMIFNWTGYLPYSAEEPGAIRLSLEAPAPFSQAVSESGRPETPLYLSWEFAL